MKEARETFLDGCIKLGHMLDDVNIDPNDVVIVLTEKDGRRLEHLLTQLDHMIISTDSDPRYSTRKADGHVREFKVAGIKFQYRPKLYKLPSGDVI